LNEKVKIIFHYLKVSDDATVGYVKSLISNPLGLKQISPTIFVMNLGSQCTKLQENVSFYEVPAMNERTFLAFRFTSTRPMYVSVKAATDISCGF
jgi:hypothetical protein